MSNRVYNGNESGVRLIAVYYLHLTKELYRC